MQNNAPRIDEIRSFFTVLVYMPKTGLARILESADFGAKKRRGHCCPRLSISNKCLLDVVVEEEFVRVRTQAQGVMFLALVADPHFQEVGGEDIALQ